MRFWTLMHNGKLTKKLVVAILAVLALVFAALSVVLSLHERQVLLHELDKKGASLAKFVADISTEPMLSYNFTYLENYVRDISAGDKDIAYAVILGADGKPLARRGAEGGDKTGIREYTGPIRENADVIGTVNIGYSTSAIDRALLKSRLLIAVLSAGTLLVIAVTMFLLFRAMALRPIEKLKTVMDAVAAGDLTVTADVRSKDEIGELGLRINGMIGSLAGLIGRIKSSSESIMAASGRIAATSENITASAGRTASTSDAAAKNNETAATAVEETSATMHEMSANVQNVARSVKHQSSCIADTSGSIEQMVASVRSVAGTVQHLVDLSRKAKGAVNAGLELVETSIRGTDEINRTIVRSADTIAALGSRVEDIGKIVDVIDEIAEQTNLLALNAAIEAARAGEQGMGFAVVAEEVRKLAERSAASTREIGELIAGIQKETQAAVKVMEKSTQLVEKGVAMSGQVSEALKTIDVSVSEVDKYSREIGGATQEQSAGGTQIAKASENLRELTREITAATEQQASAAEQIVATMETLRSTLHQNAAGTLELAKSAEQLLSRDAVELAVSVDQLRSQAGEFREIVGRFALGDAASAVPAPAGEIATAHPDGNGPGTTVPRYAPARAA
jgi:methyl-accepting chemotaxis protein